MGLGFFDLDRVAGFEVFYVRDFEFEQVAGTDSVVDTQGEQQQVTGFFGQIGLDGQDIFGVLDGVDKYLGTWFWMIGIFHGKCP